MSSAQHLREFISQRLTAAAEEIFTEFEKTIVQYEEEIDRQRRLLEITWKPRINSHTAEILQQSTFKEEQDATATDRQICNPARNSSLYQEEPEPPQIKEEQEELCISQEEAQFVLKQETDASMVTQAYEKSNHNKLEPKSDEFLSHNPPVAQGQDQEGNENEEFSINAEMTKRSRHRRSCRDSAESSSMSESLFNADPGTKSANYHVWGKALTHEPQIKNHHIVHTPEKPSLCKTCGKLFTDPSLLTRHMATHSSLSRGSDLLCHMRTQKRCSCKICGKSISNIYHLKIHMRIHTGEKPYLCNTCGKRFSDSSAFKKHIAIHSGKKPHSCEICGRSFIHGYKLKVHMRVHTGERSYPCKICEKRYTNLPALKNHTLTHILETPSCKICGKSFSKIYHLNVHMRTHTGEKPYLCNTCGKRFSDSSALKKHKTIHTGEKPYSCETCGKSFNQRSNLTVHIRTHTGETPYPCNACEKRFKTPSGLKKHTKTHKQL